MKFLVSIILRIIFVVIILYVTLSGVYDIYMSFLIVFTLLTILVGIEKMFSRNKQTER